MIRVLGIVILVLLLKGCGAPTASYQGWKNYYGSQYKFYTQACPASNPDVVEGCGFSASNNSQEAANQSAIELCSRNYSDCVVTHEGNKTIYGEADLKKVKMASMIDKAKNTCKSLGFRQGTEKFTDCSLKLYTQEMELAVKNNQQVVIQGQNSGTMTIYDPVRDSENMMRRGQSLLNGSCTLANYLSC